jgi:transcriptional regulator with XRE-family HTH domain
LSNKKRGLKMSDIRKLLGDTIKRIRQKKKISQEELTFESRLHRTYISDIERGTRNVSIKNIEKIARALNVSLRELMP